MRDWTFMVYMAGDGGKFVGDLQQFGWQNLSQMSKVGSTDRVAIIAQYDTLDNQQFTPRLSSSTATRHTVKPCRPYPR